MTTRLEVAVNETLARWDREAEAAVKIALNHGAQPLFTFQYSEGGQTYLAVQAPDGAIEQTHDGLKNTIVCRVPEDKIEATKLWLKQKQVAPDYEAKKERFQKAQTAIKQARITMDFKTGRQFINQMNKHIATLNK